MAVFLVPFIASTPQQMQISLNGVTYGFKVRWCDPYDCWIMDISDSLGNLILGGIPLITGADLMEQYAYLGLGFSLVVQTNHDADAVPTFANLGAQGNLYVLNAQ